MGDIKIGGGGSCFVYGCVGSPNNPQNPVKSTALFDNAPTPRVIEVFKCGKGARTTDGQTKLGEITREELEDGKWLGIHWDTATDQST